ncbi:MAG: aspartate--tRNA ligase [Chloroflexota bacterium]
MRFKRTHRCGDLRASDAGQTVNVMGWVHRRRDHGSLIFIDLRDRYGLVQVVINPAEAPQAHASAGEARNEFVLAVHGRVVRRDSGRENADLPTGDIEIQADDIEILNPARPLPFDVNKDVDVDESLRLKYRYLDLRRERLKSNIVARHNVVTGIREYLNARDFVEIETPILIKSTPEGARDYLVPSRVHPGEFYALPQSPQQLKQILMVAGMDRYYQIARCFRDEDLRADRQPEFTQLDLEMSFVDEDDVMSLVEGLYTHLAERCSHRKLLSKPFPRLSYKEAMSRFGSDKPDMRFGVELVDLSVAFAGTSFNAFSSALAGGGTIKAIVAPGWAGSSRKETDALIEQAKQFGAKGLVTLGVQDNGKTLSGGAAKFLSAAEVASVLAATGAGAGDLLLMVADRPEIVADVLGRLRLEVGRRAGLIDDQVLAFGWITGFPLLEWLPEDGRWHAMHNPFSSPATDDVAALKADPAGAGAKQYDLVCNGYEVGGGSARIHQAPVQKAVFELLGLNEREIQEQFGHMLEAFEYGAPPHGGIATGIERTVMLMVDETNIREVMAFPKNQAAMDLLMQAPSPVGLKQLEELHLAVTEPAPAS